MRHPEGGEDAKHPKRKIEKEKNGMSVLEKESLLEEYKKLCNRQMVFLFLRKFSPTTKKFTISDSSCYVEYSCTNLKAYSFYFAIQFSSETNIHFKFERTVGGGSYECSITIKRKQNSKIYEIMSIELNVTRYFIKDLDEYNAVDYVDKNFTSKLTTKKLDEFFIDAFKLVYCTTAIQNAFTFLLCNKHKKIFPKEIAQLIFNFVFFDLLL